MSADYEIHGNVAPGFDAARDAFTENFVREGDYQEVGAALCAFHRGRVVVDLWGGFADRARSRPWRRDTLINVWSAAKGVLAASVAVLVERGMLRYEDRVALYWPEFAAAGKGAVTLAQVLSHQAGLPGFVEHTTLDDFGDWDGCVAKLARQEPVWSPGSATSYHAMTFGWLAGEVVRRISGKSVGRFVQEEIAKPLGADIFIGLPEREEARVADMIGPRRVVDISGLSLQPAAAMALVNPQQDPEVPNTRAWRAAEIPAGNGQASALGLARLYAALANGGSLDGVTILSAATIDRMTTPATNDGRKDLLLGFEDSWGMGMAINRPGIYGPNPRAFGHSGWGGSFACVDPDMGVAIGYVCNQMGPEIVGDPRTQGLCKAVLEGAAQV